MFAVDSIEMETAHRLHFDHGVSIEDIDATEILSAPLQSSKRTFGLIHNASQRDLFEWEEAAPTGGNPLPRPPATAASNLAKRVQSVLGEFCPNLNCVQPYCATHGSLAIRNGAAFNSINMLAVEPTPLVPAVEATLTSSDLRAQATHACQRDCFLYL